MLVLLVVLTLAGVTVAVVALVVLHLLPTGLSPLRDPVSAYGISRWRQLYRTQTLATAVAAAALAATLLVSQVHAATAAVTAVVVLALTRAPIGWVPMDADGEPRSRAGRGHNVLAYGAFAAASVGGFMTGIAFAATDGLTTAAAVSTALAWVMTGASALTILSSVVRALRPIFGLAERVIYIGMFGWLAVSAVAVLGTASGA